MPGTRLRIYGADVALERVERHLAGPSSGAGPDVTPGGAEYEVLWCRLTGGGPADPPDERYWADAVEPAGLDVDGHLLWQARAGGPSGIVVHNVAEAGRGTHLLPTDAVVRAEARLDGGSPPAVLYLAHAVAGGERLARIVSYGAGAYTVQPVRREPGGFVDDGPPIDDVPNLGELWPDEAGYLDGPPAYDRYVRLMETPAGWAILLHPPRMV